LVDHRPIAFDASRSSSRCTFARCPPPVWLPNVLLRAIITGALLNGRQLPDGDAERETIINKAIWHADKIIAMAAATPTLR
jgi:hypothetical protein